MQRDIGTSNARGRVPRLSVFLQVDYVLRSGQRTLVHLTRRNAANRTLPNTARDPSCNGAPMHGGPEGAPATLVRRATDGSRPLLRWRDETGLRPAAA